MPEFVLPRVRWNLLLIATSWLESCGEAPAEFVETALPAPPLLEWSNVEAGERLLQLVKRPSLASQTRSLKTHCSTKMKKPCKVVKIENRYWNTKLKLLLLPVSISPPKSQERPRSTKIDMAALASLADDAAWKLRLSLRRCFAFWWSR